MQTVTSGELQKQFGRYSDKAMIRPVGVTRNGRLRFVMEPIEEYERLTRRETDARRDRVAGLTTDLAPSTVRAIAATEPGPGSQAAEARTDRVAGRTVDLDLPTLQAIAATEPGPGSRAAEDA